MGFVDWIKNLFSNGKEISKLYSTNLRKIKGEDTALQVMLTEKTNKPLANEKVKITVVGKTYEKVTDEKGIAKLNINLGCGNYTAKIDYDGNEIYNSSNAYSDITVSPVIQTNDLVMNQADGSQFKAKLTDINGNIQSGVNLDFVINGKTYNRTTDGNGEAALNINLNAGNYNIQTVSYNSSKINKITVKEVVKPVEPKAEEYECSSPYTQREIHTVQGKGFLGQKTGYYCGPHSLMQCIFKLTGIDLSEETLASWAGTTSAGSSHAGLETAIAQFNRQYNQNLKIKWYNHSELGWDKEACILDNPKKALFYHLLYRNQWGHYELPYQTADGSANWTIANSLGTSQGSGYYGYFETRSQATQQSYINGISQKSVCVIYI